MKNIFVALIISLLIFGCSKDTNIIDNTTESYTPNTAHFNFAVVEKQAKTLDGNSRLITIFTKNVKVDGTADSWKYIYDSLPDTNYKIRYYYLSTYLNSVNCDSIITNKIMVGGAPISKNWMNSDKALEIAENNGGNEFRLQNPDCLISVSLGEALIPESSPNWCIYYSSKNNGGKRLWININAVNGSFRIF